MNKARPFSQPSRFTVECDEGRRAAFFRNRRIQCLFDRPTVPVKAVIKQPSRHAEVGFPIDYAHCHARMGQHPRVAVVARLGSISGPSRILRAIRPVIVDAIKSKSLHPKRLVITNERRGIVPTVANNDPSPAVSGVTFIRRIITTLMHCGPRIMQRGSAHAVAHVSFSGALPIKAPARLAFAPVDTFAGNHLPCATRALAIVNYATAIVAQFRFRQDGPSGVCSSNDNHSAWHITIPTAGKGMSHG